MLIDVLKDYAVEISTFLNSLLAIPSKFIPVFTPNLTLIGISLLFGYFFNRRSELNFITRIILSIMMYCTLRFIGVG